jgi:hypothetical protein
MKEVKAYKCDYCGKLYMRYKPALNHEQNTCVNNPEIRPLCYSCKHYEQTNDTEEIVFSTGATYSSDYTEYTKTFVPNTCKILCKKLYFNSHLPQNIKDSLDENGYIPLKTIRTGGCEHYEEIKY